MRLRYWLWFFTGPQCFDSFRFDMEVINMKYASAYYVAEPTVEIYIFVDEKPSGLPEGAALIVETKDVQELLSSVEPYFILGSGGG